MVLKIGYKLKPEEIQTTITNVENSSNDLVKRVLAEEITFKDECERLRTYCQKEFHQKRDELVDALNHYDFNKIGENRKNILDYELLHSELGELKKKKKRKKAVVWGNVSGVTGLTVLAAMFDPFLAVVTGMIGGMLGGAWSGMEIDEIYTLNKKAPKGFMVLGVYYDLRTKSEEADKFMNDFQFLKKHPNLYEISSEDDDSDKTSNEGNDS